MGKGVKWQYVCGAAVMLAVTALVLVVFSLMSITEREDLYMTDSQAVRHGWRYEVLVDGQVRDYEPEYQDDGYVLALPEGVQAVRITRTMTEAVDRAELEWMPYNDGVDVVLDGQILHTDFPQLERDAAGFVHPEPEQWDQLAWDGDSMWRHMQISLPEDYLGKELSMTTYFPPGSDAPLVEYPILGPEDSVVADPVVFAVKYNAITTIYALLAILMAGMFLLDIRNNGADGKVLLLCLYFLLLFLDAAYGTSAGYYSILTDRLDLRFLREIYMVPLYLYLALRMTSRWKWLLCGGIAAWAVYEGTKDFLHLRANPDAAYSIGPEGLLVLLVLAAALLAEGIGRRALRTRQENKRLAQYGAMTAAVTAVYLFGRRQVRGSLQRYLTDGVLTAASMGNYDPAITLITTIASYVTLIVVVLEVIRRTV